jgi:hypothetical protein
LEESVSYVCSICGQIHADLPDIGFDRPDYWWSIPEKERAVRIELTEDTCVADEHFFIRAIIEIPVHDYEERFGFGVWVSQKKENFDLYLEHFDSSEIGPFFGWLSTRIAFYEMPDDSSLKTMVHFRGGNERPFVMLEPTDHQLSRDQRDGISLDKAWEIVHFYMDKAPA